jgi:hypothetical protein
MGSFSLSIRKALALYFLLTSFVVAKTIEGVNFPDERECSQEELPLQGVALRKATVFGIKVYAFAYYSKNPIKNPESAAFNERPICMEAVYLRDFSDKDVNRAWDYQFKESSQFPYDELKKDIEDVKLFFGEIKGERKESFILTKEKTIFLENSKQVGEINGINFQKNFLSIWFGKNPPTKEFQKELLNPIK